VLVNKAALAPVTRQRNRVGLNQAVFLIRIMLLPFFSLPIFQMKLMLRWALVGYSCPIRVWNQLGLW
jgi:hypothetical protein